MVDQLLNKLPSNPPPGSNPDKARKGLENLKQKIAVAKKAIEFIKTEK